MAEEADVRVCGRGDLMYVEETPRLSKYQVESNRDSSHPEDRTIYSRYPFCIYVPPSISPSSSTSSEEEPADDYFGNVTIDRYAKRQVDDYAPSEASSKRASESFREMYIDKHITHQTDDPEAATDEHSDAGPELEDDQRLQKLIGNIVEQSGSENDSSDSCGMQKSKKRKSIAESQDTANQVAERFRQQLGDGTDPSLAKVLW
jgi:hypothetical protein